MNFGFVRDETPIHYEDTRVNSERRVKDIGYELIHLLLAHSSRVVLSLYQNAFPFVRCQDNVAGVPLLGASFDSP
jgi:hypothetical protein